MITNSTLQDYRNRIGQPVQFTNDNTFWRSGDSGHLDSIVMNADGLFIVVEDQHEDSWFIALDDAHNQVQFAESSEQAGEVRYAV